MRRRTYLLGCASATAALAGCSAIGGDGGDSGDDANGSAGDGSAANDTNSSDSDDSSDGDDGSEETANSPGPAETARAFYEAMAAGDAAAANELLHSESPDDPVTESEAADFESLEGAVEDVTVSSSDETVATVAIELSFDDGSGGRTTSTLDIELRTEDGEWRIYEDLSSGGSGSNSPSISLDIHTSTTDGEVSAIEFTVQSIDGGVDPSTLSVQVQAQEATVSNASESLTAGDTIVASFDGDGSSYSAGTKVQLFWNSPDDGSSTTLAYDDLSSETTGALASNLELQS